MRVAPHRRLVRNARRAALTRKLFRVTLGCLLLSVSGLVGATPLVGASELLKKADDERTANFPEFVAIVDSVEQLKDSLSPQQREYLDYLEAWRSGYSGDSETALARLTRLINDSKDPTVRMRAGATAVNMLVFGKRYEEAFVRLSGVLELLPNVTDGTALQQAQLNAAGLYEGVGQYDLSLSYAQQVIDANWAGRGLCKGSQQKIIALYDSGQLKSVLQALRAAEDCAKVGEITYTGSMWIVAAKTFIKQDEMDAAIKLLKEHYAEVTVSRNPRLMAKWNAVLAEAYQRKGLPALAQSFARDVIDGGEKDDFTESLSTAYSVLYQLAKERGDFKSALEFHERFAATDKAYLTDLSARHLAFQKVNHENIANKLQVDALNKQNHVLQLERQLGSKAVETSRLYIVLLTMSVVFIGLWAYRTKRSQLHFQTLSRLDGLTGICNRPYFIAQAEKALEASQRTGEHLCIILFDLDHFKSINDRYGHATGDFVLKRTVSACQGLLTKEQIFCRFGGEEFALLLPGCDMDKGRQRAEQLRVTIAGITANQGTAKATVSASFGITSTSQAERDLGQLLAQADAALYEAKRTGRNRVVSHGQPTEVIPLSIVAPTGDIVQYAGGRSSNG